MNSILNSMALDYRIIKTSNKILVLMAYGIALIYGSLTKVTYIMVPIVMIITAMSNGMFFSAYEKNNLSKLYGVMPIRRSSVVTARYLYTVIFGIANGVVAGTLMYVVSSVRNINMSSFQYSLSLSGAFLFYCLITSIIFPIYFKFGFSKAYVFSNLPFYLIFVGTLILTRNAKAMSSLGNTIQYFTNNQAMIWVIGIVGGLVLIGASYRLSCSLFSKSEM